MTRTNRRNHAVALLLAVATGCSQSPPHDMMRQDTSSLDATSFLHSLSRTPMASNGDGVRAMLLLADGEERFKGYDEQAAELVRRGALRDAWSLDPNATLDFGTLAFMIRHICDVPGGVNSVLLAGWGLGDRRYALKATQAAGLMPAGVAATGVRGGELVAILTRVDAYQAKRSADETRIKDVDSPHDVAHRPPPVNQPDRVGGPGG